MAHTVVDVEIKKWIKEFEKANKKYHHYMQLCCDKDVNIKKMDIEINRLRKLVPSIDKKRNMSSEEEYSHDSNPPLSGPPQSGTITTTEETPEYIQGYGLNSGLIPPGSPARAAAD